MQRNPNEIWLVECVGKTGDHSRTSATFWNCIPFDSVGTLDQLVVILIPRNTRRFWIHIDCQLLNILLYTNISWMTMHRYRQFQAHMITRKWKNKSEIPNVTWPVQFMELIIIGNVGLWHTIKVKLQDRTGTIKMQAQLTDAVCRIWKFVPVGYTLEICTCLFHVDCVL